MSIILAAVYSDEWLGAQVDLTTALDSVYEITFVPEAIRTNY